jgi:hypothetical protein
MLSLPPQKKSHYVSPLEAFGLRINKVNKDGIGGNARDSEFREATGRWNEI